LKVIVCSGDATEPCAKARPLGKRPLRVRVSSSAGRVRIALARR
jgi:hypothetical protein